MIFLFLIISNIVKILLDNYKEGKIKKDFYQFLLAKELCIYIWYTHTSVEALFD
jgi:hypothetical protein